MKTILRSCPIIQDRKRRDVQLEKRIIGGQSVVQGAMPYVSQLEFRQNDSENTAEGNNQLCAGTVINKYFIITTKFCCDSGNLVTINFENDSEAIESSTFYSHSTLDVCLIRVEKDLSRKFDNIPCLPNNFDINRYNGAACWNAGWGTAEVGGTYADELQSIGVNLMSQGYCTDHSFWEVEDGHMCAGLPPSDSTPMKGWKHVTAGGKGTCQGDFGSPLICDIDGIATLIGINSNGDFGECGQAGKPAIHVGIMQLLDWLNQIIDDHSPPKTCFKLIADPSIEGALGDEIKILKNDLDIGVALNAHQVSNEVCFNDVQENDIFKFVTAGDDNVSFPINSKVGLIIITYGILKLKSPRS